MKPSSLYIYIFADIVIPEKIWLWLFFAWWYLSVFDLVPIWFPDLDYGSIIFTDCILRCCDVGSRAPRKEGRSSFDVAILAWLILPRVRLVKNVFIMLMWFLGLMILSRLNSYLSDDVVMQFWIDLLSLLFFAIVVPNGNGSGWDTSLKTVMIMLYVSVNAQELRLELICNLEIYIYVSSHIRLNQ